MKKIETARLHLREFRDSDYEDIVAQIYTDREVWGMYSGIGGDLEEVQRRFLHRCNQPANSEFGFRAIELKETGRVIGQIHLEPQMLDPRSIPEVATTPFHTIEVELAFAFGKDYWGKGFANEACLAMIDYAFRELKLRRLVGGAVFENTRSLKLHERLGFSVEPDPTDANFMSAVLVNTLLYDAQKTK